jgi:hypothetical protein
LKEFLAGLRSSQATTDVEALHPALRGRTYAIPFETVWQGVVSLAGGGLRDWSIASADDQIGVVTAHARGGLLRPAIDVRISVRLDHNAQTRVDIFARTYGERHDLGRSRRLIARFTRQLDRKLHAQAGQILDPRTLPARMSESKAP